MTLERKFLDLGMELFEEMAKCGMKTRKWTMPNDIEITINDLKRKPRNTKDRNCLT